MHGPDLICDGVQKLPREKLTMLQGYYLMHQKWKLKISPPWTPSLSSWGWNRKNGALLQVCPMYNIWRTHVWPQSEVEWKNKMHGSPLHLLLSSSFALETSVPIYVWSSREEVATMNTIFTYILMVIVFLSLFFTHSSLYCLNLNIFRQVK